MDSRENVGHNLAEERRRWSFAKRLYEGDVVWRPAVAHAAEGIQPYDVECRAVAENIGRRLLIGYVVYGTSGDVEGLGVLPENCSYEAQDTAFRVVTKWLPHDVRNNRFYGFKIFMSSEPPVGWTHIRIDRVEKIETLSRGYLKYVGVWESDPYQFAKRYFYATLSDMSRTPDGKRLVSDNAIVKKISTMFVPINKVRLNLGLSAIPEVDADEGRKNQAQKQGPTA